MSDRCPKCRRPFAEDDRDRGKNRCRGSWLCDDLAAAYRRGYVEAVAMCKDEAIADTRYIGGGHYAGETDWTDVDAKAKEVLDG